MTVNRLQSESQDIPWPSRPWSPLTMVFPPGIQPIGRNLIRWPDGVTTATFVTRVELYDTVVVNELACALGLEIVSVSREGDLTRVEMESERAANAQVNGAI